MKIHRGLDHLPQFHKAVLTIGSFDGVHQGHRSILKEIVEMAKANKGESILMTFHPHPRQVIYPNDGSLQLLNTLDEKIALIAQTGIDHLVIVPFTFEFSRMEAEEYVQKILVNRFDPDHIVIGYDHRFGLNRSGDVHYLRSLQSKYGFKVTEIEKQTVDDLVVSSTKIRKALSNKEIIKANQLLGSPYRLTGKVIKGMRIGKTLGYPTANIEIEDKHKLVVPFGIYAVRILIDGLSFKGMLYIGSRPTLDENLSRSIEIHIFDYNDNLYGEKIGLEILAYIRDDEKFDDLEALKKSIHGDEKVIRRLFYRLDDEDVITKCAIVILNFNGRQHLERYLPSILKSQSKEVEIVIADNASTDDSVSWLEENFPNIRLIRLQKNHGFAGGYNEALKQVQAKYYILLNSDVEPVEGFANHLIKALDTDPNLAACQPKVRALKNKTHFEYAGASGGFMDSLGYPLCRGRILASTEKDLGQYDDPIEIFWATGAAMAIRSKLFHKIGGFDDWYFAHQEEIDLCWRLKRAGYLIKVIPASMVYHLGGGTLDYLSERKTYLNFRNSLANIIKNVPLIKAAIMIVARLLLDGVAGIYFLSKGQNRHILAVLKAHLAFYKAIPYLLDIKKKYNFAVRDVRCQNPRTHTGRYKGSIVWQYYVKGVRAFNKL